MAFLKVHNVLSQGRQNLPPKHLTTIHHVTTQSMQKLEYLCYTITHLPKLQLADCYWCPTMQNLKPPDKMYYTLIYSKYSIMYIF
jgi:hypothetical protein